MNRTEATRYATFVAVCSTGIRGAGVEKSKVEKSKVAGLFVYFFR
jgi:hypothetical protein